MLAPPSLATLARRGRVVERPADAGPAVPSWTWAQSAKGCDCRGRCGGACGEGCRSDCGCAVPERFAGTVTPERALAFVAQRHATARDVPLDTTRTPEVKVWDGVDGSPPWWRSLAQPGTRVVDAVPSGSGPWLDRVEGLGAFEFPDGGPCEEPSRYCFASSREPKLLSCSDATYKDRVVVDSNCGESMAALVREAWCLLNDNTDLIRTACCWASDEEDAADRVIERLRRTSFRVDIKCPDLMLASDGLAVCDVADPTVSIVPARGYEDLGGGVVELCLTANNMAEPLGLWHQGGDENRTCACVVVAAVLFHELLHVCDVESWVDHSDGRGETGCDPIYFAEQALLWMLLTRYRAAMRCCECQGAYGSWADGRPRDVRDSIIADRTLPLFCHGGAT